MKKFISILSVLLVAVLVPIGLSACDGYSRKSYALTSFTILKPDNTEFNIAEYKKFLGINNLSADQLEHQYNKDLNDITAVKEYMLAVNSYVFDFDAKNNVVFTHTKIINNVLGNKEVKSYTGTYTDKNNSLELKFKNFKYDASNNIIVSSLGDPIVEEREEIPSFKFGEAYGNLNTIRNSDGSFIIILYSGLSSSSSRVELVFSLVK